MKFYLITFFCSFLYGACTSNRVLELNDRFLEFKDRGSWFVKFYAPWCGHCKHLEPIWSQVAQSLVDTDIRVARVDCTKHTSIATEFGVRGFPTLIFIKGKNRVEYKGERTREELVEFARRVDGPAFEKLTTCEALSAKRDAHKVMFVLAEVKTPQEVDDALRANFSESALEFHATNYFYTIPAECIPKVSPRHTSPPDSNAVYLFKDRDVLRYQIDSPGEDANGTTLSAWIERERFPIFQKISYSNFYQIMRTGKHLVALVLEENPRGKIDTMKQQEFLEMMETLAIRTKDLFYKDFLFGWFPNTELPNSLTMTELSVPMLFVLQPETYRYYLIDTDMPDGIPSAQDVINTLQAIREGTASSYGGNTFFYRVYRAIFDAKSSFMSMWRGNPVLTSVLFGLPLAFFSIIVYMTCCSGMLEAREDEEFDSEDDEHEKAE